MDDRIIDYAGEMLEELDLAYAVTVHKSQGSEFPAVIIPVLNFPPMLMTRNLLYTAVTRGKQLVLIIGDPARVRMMIDNNRADGRYTGLKSRLIMQDADPFGIR
jgi:exodeoxyribonuclease V alpha subunit